MRSTKRFSITLPNEMAGAVRAKAAAGWYVVASEVIRDGLRALLARDWAVEEWLRKAVAASYDKLETDPSRAVAVGAVKAPLSAASKEASMTEPTWRERHLGDNIRSRAFGSAYAGSVHDKRQSQCHQR